MWDGLVGWGRDRQPPDMTPGDKRPVREWEPRWRPGLSGARGASGGETCDPRSSWTSAPSRPAVPGMRTVISPHPVHHSAGDIRPDHRSWDRVQSGVHGASSLDTSGCASHVTDGDRPRGDASGGAAAREHVSPGAIWHDAGRQHHVDLMGGQGSGAQPLAEWTVAFTHGGLVGWTA